MHQNTKETEETKATRSRIKPLASTLGTKRCGSPRRNHMKNGNIPLLKMSRVEVISVLGSFVVEKIYYRRDAAKGEEKIKF